MSPDYKPVVCPECGSEDVRWVEDIPVTRTVFGIGPSGRVVVEDSSDWPCLEGGMDERLFCLECGNEWQHEAGYSYGKRAEDNANAKEVRP